MKKETTVKRKTVNKQNKGVISVAGLLQASNPGSHDEIS